MKLNRLVSLAVFLGSAASAFAQNPSSAAGQRAGSDGVRVSSDSGQAARQHITNPLLGQDWAGFDRYAEANAGVTEAPRAVFMGDSITEYWVDIDPAFFRDNGFIGRGISGQTSSKMLARFQRDVIELHPELVVISCGTNDVAMNNGRISLDNVVTQIKSMADLARYNGIIPVVVSVPPCNHFFWRPEVESPAGSIIELNVKIKAYCDAEGIPYVDYHSAMAAEDGSMEKAYSEDGCHPVLEGYRVMERTVLPVIEKAIAGRRTGAAVLR